MITKETQKIKDNELFSYLFENIKNGAKTISLFSFKYWINKINDDSIEIKNMSTGNSQLVINS